MVHEANGFGEQALVDEFREPARRSPREIVANAIRQTAARAVPARQAPREPSGEAFMADAGRRQLSAVGPGSLAFGRGLSPVMGSPFGVDDPLEEIQADRVQAIAQEVRATLALISGYSQSVAHLPLDNDAARRYLEQLPVAAAHLAELTTELVEICGADESPSPPEPVRLRPING